MNTILCLHCQGTGGHNAMGAYWWNSVGPRLRDGRCDYCEGKGILGEFTEVRLVSRAYLCEVCGCRSFNKKCTARKDFHDAHAHYTRMIRSGTVYFHPYPASIFPRLREYNWHCWNRKGEASGFDTPDEQREVGWVSLPVDEAEDLQSTYCRDNLTISQDIEAARLVRENNLPLWEALNQAHCDKIDVLLARTMGYSLSIQRSTPNPVQSMSYFCIAIPPYVPPWLQSAWEMGYPTLYDEQEYDHLKRRPEIHGD